MTSSVLAATSAPRARVRPRALVPVSVGVAAGLASFLGSWAPSYWSDEVATVRAASLPLPELFAFVQQKDAVHAFYYVLMHLWSTVAGTSELSLRAPSAVGIAIAAGGLVVIGRLLERPGLGVTAAAVFAILPRTTSMGLEARSYALTAALAVLLTVALLIAERNPRPLTVASYGVLVAVSLLFFVYLAFLVVAHALVLALRRPDRRTTARLVSVVVVAVAVTAPWLIVVAGQKGQIAWLGSRPVLNVWTVLGEPWFESSIAACVVGWGLLIAGAVRWRGRHRPAGGRERRSRVGHVPSPALLLAAAWVVVPTVLLLALNVPFGPLYTSRYLSFCEPGFALLVATAVTSFGRKRVAVALVALLVLASLPAYLAQRGPYAKNGGSDLGQLAALVHERSHPGDVVLFEPLERGSTGYNTRQAIQGYPGDFGSLDDVGLIKRFPAFGTFSDETAAISAVVPRLPRAGRVWFLASSLTDRCASLPAIRPLLDDGWTVAHSYPVHRDTACELTRGG